MPESPEEAILRAVAHFNNSEDDRACLDLYAPDCRVFGLPNVRPSRQGILDYLEQVRVAFPDVVLTVGDLFAETDRAVLRFEITGTQQGVFMGISPTGKRIKLSGMILFRFESGRCAECWYEVNFLSLLQQTGILPA